MLGAFATGIFLAVAVPITAKAQAPAPAQKPGCV
jgi:hypothetical protein